MKVFEVFNISAFAVPTMNAAQPGGSQALCHEEVIARAMSGAERRQKMSWRVRILLIVALVPLVTGGCTDGGSAPTSASEISEPQEVTIVAVDYAYPEAPTELEGGVVSLTFENQGKVTHEGALVEIGDTPLNRFVEDLGRGIPGFGGVPFPDYMDEGVVPSFGFVEGGATGEATFTITEGRYAMFCTITDAAEGDKKAPHYERGMLRELTVVGGDAEPELPEADGTITATDYAFDVDLEAGDRTVNFINEGPDQVHYTFVEVYPEGIDASEAEEAFKTQLEPGPTPEGVPSPEELGLFSGTVTAGLGSRFQLDAVALESGRTYLFACFLNDRAGGEPHAIAYNMIEAVTIE